MVTPEDRAAELIAAAANGELSPDERREFERLRQVRPDIVGEVEALRALGGRIGETDVAWVETRADDALLARILAATGDAAGASPTRAAAAPVALTPTRSRRPRPWVPALLAAACLALGVVVGAWIPGALNAPPVGPPGTLGAVEPIDLRDEPDEVSIEGDVVAHTWGTESVIRASGLDVGAVYSVVLIGADGTEFPAGEMLGSEVPIDCRLNAAVLREDVAGMEIRTAEGATVAVAELPSV